MTISLRWKLAVTALVLALACSGLPASGADPDAAWKTNLLAWRATYEKDLRAPTGWLTLVGLEWLKPGDNAFGSAADNPIVLKAPAAPHMGDVRLAGQTLDLLPPSGGFPKGLLVTARLPPTRNISRATTPGILPNSRWPRSPSRSFIGATAMRCASRTRRLRCGPT